MIIVICRGPNRNFLPTAFHILCNRICYTRRISIMVNHLICNNRTNLRYSNNNNSLPCSETLVRWNHRLIIMGRQEKCLFTRNSRCYTNFTTAILKAEEVSGTMDPSTTVLVEIKVELGW